MMFFGVIEELRLDCPFSEELMENQANTLQDGKVIFYGPEYYRPGLSLFVSAVERELSKSLP